MITLYLLYIKPYILYIVKNGRIFYYFNMYMKEKECAVTFAQLRGIDQYVGTYGSRKTAHIISNYFTIGKEILSAGFRSRYTNGEIMTLFSDPAKAVTQMFLLRKKVSSFLKDRTLDLACGIHFGKLIMCTTKSGIHAQVGKVINIAKRIEQASYGGDISISKDVYSQLSTKTKKNFTLPQNIRIKKWGILLPIYTAIR